MRAEVPSMTSTIAPSCPSDLGPEIERPASQYAIAVRIAFTSTGVSAFGVDAGRCSRETWSIGLRGSTSCRTASPSASRSTTRACLARL